jgi:hypothetical protein
MRRKVRPFRSFFDFKYPFRSKPWSVTGELVDHPLPIERLFRSVMQDMQPDEAFEQLLMLQFRHKRLDSPCQQTLPETSRWGAQRVPPSPFKQYDSAVNATSWRMCPQRIASACLCLVLWLCLAADVICSCSCKDLSLLRWHGRRVSSSRPGVRTAWRLTRTRTVPSVRPPRARGCGNDT